MSRRAPLGLLIAVAAIAPAALHPGNGGRHPTTATVEIRRHFAPGAGRGSDDTAGLSFTTLPLFRL